MAQIASINLLRKLQEEGYAYLVSRRSAGKKTGFYIAERGEDWPERLSGFPLEEDDALSIDEALRWMSDDELKSICVITSPLIDTSSN